MLDQQSNISNQAQQKEDVGGEINLQAVYDIPLKISAILGHAELKVNQILKLNKGAVVELDKKVGDAIDICINDKLVARGEIVLVDNKIGVTLTEIFKSD